MPDFYLVMDIFKPVESFAMWPQMITQECVPDASCLHDWWLPDGCLGEGRKRYRFSMFLSNKTPWSSGEGRHMIYKRRCSWRGEIKQRTSGKPYTIVAFSALSQIMVSCIPKSRKAGRRGKPGCSHPGRSCIFAQHKGQQNPLQESQWGSLLGQMHPSGSTSLLGGQAVFRWWDKGAASLWGSFHAWRARPSSVAIQAGLKGLSHCSSGFLIASLCL